MQYADEVRVTKTLFVNAEDLPGIKTGVIFSNSKPTGAGVTVLHNGGIDYAERSAHYDHRTIKRHRAAGRFLIVYKKRVYQYAYTREV